MVFKLENSKTITFFRLIFDKSNSKLHRLAEFCLSTENRRKIKPKGLLKLFPHLLYSMQLRLIISGISFRYRQILKLILSNELR